MNILQIYNWTVEDESLIRDDIHQKFILPNNIYFSSSKIMICHTFNQVTNQRVNIMLPAYYCATVISDDSNLFRSLNHHNIILEETKIQREAVYNSEPKEYVYFYLKSIPIQDPRITNYYNGQSLQDTFFNQIRINPSSYIDYDILSRDFDIHELVIKKYGREYTELICVIHDEDITLFMNSTIHPDEATKRSIFSRCVDVMSFDMEVFTEENATCMVTPTKDINAIVCISSILHLAIPTNLQLFLDSICDEHEKVILEKALYYTVVITYYPSDEPEDIINSITIVDNRIDIVCNSEVALIITFVKMFQWLDVHHLTGHNILLFDLKFLHDRIMYIQKTVKKVKPIMYRKSHIFQDRILKTRVIYSKNRDMTIPDNSGDLIIVDFMNYAKKYRANMGSYGLAGCSEEILSWKSKYLGQEEFNNKTYQKFSLAQDSILRISTAKYIKIKDIQQVVDCIVTKDYILLDISNEELSVESINLAHCKADFDLLGAFGNYTKENHILCITYCIHDANLSMRLYMKDDVHNSIVTYSMYNKMSQSQVTIYENNRSIGSVLLQKLTDMNFILKSKQKNKDSKKYKAAYVQEPELPFIDDPVLVYDIDAQYPNCFIAGNLSYETIVESHTFTNNIECSIKAKRLRQQYKTSQSLDYMVVMSTTSSTESIPLFYVAVFDRRVMGVIPTFLRGLLLERIERKNKIAYSKKELLKPNLPRDEIIKLETIINFESKIEKSIKLLTNSTYGFLGSNIFDLSRPELARTCTAMGVIVIKYLIDILRVNISILAEVESDHLTYKDMSLHYNREIIKPLDYPSIDGRKFNKDLKSNLDPEKTYIILHVSSSSSYSDTDSCFQRCKLTNVEYILPTSIESKNDNECNEGNEKKNELLTLDSSKANHKDLLKVFFNFGIDFANILNREFLNLPYKLKFEKLLCYLSIIKKRYSSYIYTSFHEIDLPPKMSHSGGSLIQRSSNTFHKNTILQLELFLRKQIMASVPYEEIKVLLKNEINRIKNQGIADIESGKLTYKDFMISRNFKKTKNIDYKMYQDVLAHNETVKAGTNTNNVQHISLGDRYYTVILVPVNGPISKKITDHITIINNLTPKIIPDMKIHFDHYWNLINNDIENRFSIW